MVSMLSTPPHWVTVGYHSERAAPEGQRAQAAAVAEQQAKVGDLSQPKRHI